MQVTATIRYTSRLGAGIATAALMMTLAACGGGGGSGGSTSSAAPPASIAPITPANPAPTNPPPSNPPPTSTATAELTWTAPTQNEDGTALTNLGGYKVRYGQSHGALGQVLDIPAAGTTSARVEGLSGGTWYFTVASYTNTGVESVPTGAVSKTIT